MGMPGLKINVVALIANPMYNTRTDAVGVGGAVVGVPSDPTK